MKQVAIIKIVFDEIGDFLDDPNTVAESLINVLDNKCAENVSMIGNKGLLKDIRYDIMFVRLEDVVSISEESILCADFRREKQ